MANKRYRKSKRKIKNGLYRDTGNTGIKHRKQSNKAKVKKQR